MRDDEKWFSAAFTVKSFTITPEEVEKLLCIEPTRKHHIGDPVSTRNNNVKRKDYYYCIHSSCSSEQTMENHLDEILSLLEDKKKEIYSLSKTEDVCFFCGFSSGNGQGGFTLSPEILSRLAGLEVPLSLDLYPPSGAGLDE